MEEPILSSVLASYVDKSSSIEIEEADRSKKEHSSEGFKQATWTKRQNTKEVEMYK